jgi:hypothetical protein
MALPLAALVALIGCATQSAHVDEAKVARLPTDERAQLVEQERAVDAAQSNLNAAKAAQHDAEDFKTIAAGERSAAEEQAQAEHKAVEVAQRKPDQPGLGSAQKTEVTASQRLEAAQAKELYASKLGELRDAQVSEAQASLNEAQAKLELAKLDRLAAHGQASDLNRDTFARAVADTRSKTMQAHSETEIRRATAKSSRSNWVQVAEKYGLPSNQTAKAPPVDAPAAKPID